MELKVNGRLGVIQRRRMGLTVKNILAELKSMKDEGKLAAYASEEGVDVANLSATIAGRLAEKRPADWQDIDWDAVLAFIEKLLELLIKFLPLIIDLFT